MLETPDYPQSAPGEVVRRGWLPDVSDAVLLIDKPKGISSFGVIRRLRHVLQVKKIGHAGTLDPMASGLLICLVGRATKRMETFMQMEKTYLGTIRLGETTASYDAETEVEQSRPWEHVTDEAIEEALQSFRGAIKQAPPMFSAVKIGGERLYRKARRGELVERPERDATIYLFQVLSRAGSDLHVEVRCSKGTYVRSLAHDLGEALGCGGHLVALRRTGIGEHRADQAWTPEELGEACGRPLTRRGDGDGTA